MSENETVSELNDVRERLKALSERLGEAETHLRFYANPRSYLIKRAPAIDKVFQDILMGDHSESDNDPNTFVAGNRARVYLKKY